MKKHVFLTGDIQIGKSTAIDKALSILNIEVGGFRTKGVTHQKDGTSNVVLFKANGKPETGHIVAERREGTRKAFPEIFDTYGPVFLNEKKTITIMDELGFLESQSEIFCSAIIETLNSDTHVLGVVRNMRTPFLDKIRNRDDVILIIVTEENRDEIPGKIVEIMRDMGISPQE